MTSQLLSKLTLTLLLSLLSVFMKNEKWVCEIGRCRLRRELVGHLVNFLSKPTQCLLSAVI